MTQRPLECDTLDAALAELDRLDQGYDQHGQWDLARTCWHLAYFVEGSLDGFSPNDRALWIIRVLFGRRLLKQILDDIPFKPGIKIPDRFRPPTGLDQTEQVTRLQNLLTRLKEPNAAVHPSPFFGPITHSQWQKLHRRHCAHHFSFLSPKT